VGSDRWLETKRLQQMVEGIESNGVNYA